MTQLMNAKVCTHLGYTIIIELLDTETFKDKARVLLSIFHSEEGRIYIHCNGGTIETNLDLAKKAIKKHTQKQAGLRQLLHKIKGNQCNTLIQKW